MRARFWAWLLLAMLVAVDARAERTPRLLFRFSAGSSLFARPGLGQDGALYVGSGDGYVHALGPDGSYRWSYTVKGRVVAPPVEEPSSGHVFVATSERRLYALERDSRLRWVFPLPVAPKTELLLTPKGTLFFVGQDDHLYGVTTGGALSLRLAAPDARSAPALLESGEVALVLGDELARLKGYGYERSAVGAVFSASARLALEPDRAVLACEDGVSRVVGARELSHGECLAPPVRGDGFVALAEPSGLRLIFADGSVETWALSGVPLRPRWDAPRRRLVAATASGSVSVLELPGGPA